MKKGLDRVIGYDAIKTELARISDSLKNREAYEKLGVSSPRGLLLHGDPGVGKTIMANAVIEESGRKAFVCRKDLPNGAFVKAIKSEFTKANDGAAHAWHRWVLYGIHGGLRRPEGTVDAF